MQGGSGKCFSCTKEIFSKAINVDGKSYHPNCFICSMCKRKLQLDSYKRIRETLYCEHDYKVYGLKSALG